jgi:DNA-directed RNA polymerase alpha subunit
MILNLKHEVIKEYNMKTARTKKKMAAKHVNNQKCAKRAMGEVMSKRLHLNTLAEKYQMMM